MTKPVCHLIGDKFGLGDCFGRAGRGRGEVR
jgi:hypothetical protein